MKINGVNVLWRLSLFAAVAVFIFGCGKEEKYPIEPVITFKTISVFDNNNFTLTLGFTDGDGNIGLEKGDTSGVFSPDSVFYYNCFISFYRKNGEQYEPLNFTPPYYYRIPLLTPDERNKNIKGDIQVNVQGLTVDGTEDTLLIDVYIADRSLNVSNKVSSTPFVLTRP